MHLMGIGRDDLVRTVVEEAGLFPRPTSVYVDLAALVDGIQVCARGPT